MLEQDALSRIEERLAAIERKLDRVDTAPPRLVTYEEAAGLLSCSVTVIKEMLRAGRLRRSKLLVGSRKRIPMTELAKFAEPMPAPKRKARAVVASTSTSLPRSDAEEAAAIRAIGRRFRRDGGGRR